MEYIKKEDLIEGEIYYVSTNYSFWMIGLVTKSNNGDNDHGCFRGNATYISNDEKQLIVDSSWCYKSDNRTNRLATPEEKHWLNECIKLDKFITFDEAMKTFIPEYVEWVDNIGSGSLGYQTQYTFQKNKIFKTNIELPTAGFQTQDWKKHLEIYPNNYKPSTKEAYDAQFIVKEPEFVLPEKWCIKVTNENRLELKNKLPRINAGFLENQYIYYCDINKNNFKHSDNWSWNINKNRKLFWNYRNIDENFIFPEITLEQFKKYVLKEETAIEFGNKIDKEIIEPLPQFKIIETIETITKVENNEGNQFFIGDVVKSESNIVQTIKSFKYNVDKTNILATTNISNQIGINKIEHYIETGISLNEIKEKYPIGTFVKSVISSKVVEIKDYDLFHSNTNGDVLSYNQGSIILYQDGIWAEKVEPKVEFILSEKWCIKCNESNYKPVKEWAGYDWWNSGFNKFITCNKTWLDTNNGDYTEITFDQFKKYVLKEEELSPIQLANNVEESLLDKAKRLYPVGTKFKVVHLPDLIATVKNHDNYKFQTDEIVNLNVEEKRQGVTGASVYYKGKWAEIVEYSHGFKVGDKIKLNKIPHSPNFRISKIEGNVLFYDGNNKLYENHYRILAKNAIKVN